MNIFILDKDPQMAAIYHSDKHVVKMILESAQMMSTTVRLSGIDAGYKIAYKNHPCTIWARESLSNWLWLGNLTYYLNQEFKYRFNKKENHKSYDVVYSLPWPNIKNIGPTLFAQAMPEKYKHNNAIVAYRNYYLKEKSHLFQWTKRKSPYWINTMTLDELFQYCVDIGYKSDKFSINEIENFLNELNLKLIIDKGLYYVDIFD